MNNTLFELIKSLSQTEKRYFRLQSSISFSRDDKSYVRLFDLINDQRIYDEASVKTKFNDAFFAQKKRHLFNKILESLRAYHQGYSTAAIIDAELGNYKLLLSKSLINQAAKSLKRAELLAINHEHFADLIRIKSAETELYIAEGNPTHLSQHIENLRKSLPDIIKKIDQNIEIEKEYVLFVKWNNETELVRSIEEKNKLTLSVSKKTLGRRSQISSVTAKLKIFYINGLYNFLCGNFEKSLIHFEDQTKCYSNNLLIANEHQHDFAKSIANTTLLCSKLKLKSKFDSYLQQLSLINGKAINLIENKDYWIYVLKLNWHVNQHQFEDANRWIAKNQNKIILLEKKLEQNNLLITERNYVFFDTLITFYMLGEIKKANKLLNNYLNLTSTSTKTDAFSMARILSLFFQLELKQFDLLEYNLISVQRYLKEGARLFEFEKQSVLFFKEILKCNNEKEIKTSWLKYKTKLVKLKDDPIEKNAFAYIDILVIAELKCK